MNNFKDPLERAKIRLKSVLAEKQTLLNILVRGCKEKKKLYLGVGTESFNTTGVVQVQIKESDVRELDWKVIKNIVIDYILTHEAGHSLYTTNEGFGGTIECEIEWVNQKANDKGLLFNQRALGTVCHFIVNSIEDGRIERIMSYKSESFKTNMNWYRFRDWKKEDAVCQDVGKMPEYVVFMNQVLFYATMGRFQKGFTKKYKGSSLYTDVCSVRKYIKKGTHAHRCIEIKEPCMDIMKVLYPYLEEGLQSIPKELLDMLDKIKQMLEENSTNISRESDDDGEGIPIPVKMEEEDKKSQKSKNSDTSEESEHGSKEDGTEEKDSEGKSGSKEDDSESDSKEDGSDSESESEEDGSNSGKDSEDENSEEDVKEDGSNSGSDSEEENSEEDAEEDGSKSEGDSEENDSDSKGDSESEEDEMSDEDFEKDAEKQMENHEKSARDKKESRTGHETDVLDALEQAYEDERELWDLLEEKQDISNKFKISPEKALEGNRFKRFVDRTMKQRSINDRTDQYGGFVNTNQLYKIASGQPNFYCQKGQPYLPDARVYILIDNSGSMGRTKFSEAQKAASVIEEGFKGIVPLKTVCFDTDTEHTEDGNYIRKPDPITGRLNYNDIVRHIIVKDWQDNSRAFNYSETFRQNNHAGGGNKDGYSIRVAATELASYDEQKKLLIVLSDGEPTDYRYVDPYLDTHNAVVQARQMGISVVSIFFGDESYIKSSERVYKAMYEKDYIGVTPDHIQDELQKLLKKII